MAGERIESISWQKHSSSSSRWRPTISERRILLMLGDIGMLSLALFVAVRYWLPGAIDISNWQQVFLSHLYWWLTLWALWIIISIAADCYNLHRAADVVRAALTTGGFALLTCGAYLIIPIISAPLTHSRLAWIIFALTAVLGVAIWRALFAHYIGNGGLLRRVLVVGAGVSGHMFAQVVNERGPASGIEIVGFVDDNAILCGAQVEGHSILTTSERLFELASSRRVDDIVVAITDPTSICPALKDAIVRCWQHGVVIKPFSLLYEEITTSIPVEHVGQNLHALTQDRSIFATRLWDMVRRGLDIIAALIGLAVLLPLLPLLALAIAINSPGPIFYRQERVGQGGKVFRLTKFRSMIPDAERGGAVWAQEGDNRITLVGRFMRKTRLDELPQLWNMLRGDMSLIGPRPERPEFVESLDDLLPYYAIRHSIKPGLTGWAQTHYRYGRSIDDARNKLQYDLYYVKHRGPVLDFLIVLDTIRVVLCMQGS